MSAVDLDGAVGYDYAEQGLGDSCDGEELEADDVEEGIPFHIAFPKGIESCRDIP